MLSSIHPLGERARDNRWAITVSAFTLGAIISGSTVGAVLGFLGSATAAPLSTTTLLAMTAVTALIAGSLDLAKVRAPGPARQVNETWIGAYRGWVYGGAFGLELGLGLMTYVVTWGVYATYVAAYLTVSPVWGALIGAIFGLGRAIPLILAGWVDRPSRLTTFNRRLAVAGPIVRTVSAVSFSTLGASVLLAGLL